jgi:hypothetical protein
MSSHHTGTSSGLPVSHVAYKAQRLLATSVVGAREVIAFLRLSAIAVAQRLISFTESYIVVLTALAGGSVDRTRTVFVYERPYPVKRI